MQMITPITHMGHGAKSTQIESNVFSWRE